MNASSEQVPQYEEQLGHKEQIQLTWRSWVVVLITCFAQMAQVFVIAGSGQNITFIARDLGNASLAAWVIRKHRVLLTLGGNQMLTKTRGSSPDSSRPESNSGQTQRCARPEVVGVNAAADSFRWRGHFGYCELDVNTYWWWHSHRRDTLDNISCTSHSERSLAAEIPCCCKWCWLRWKRCRRNCGISRSREGDQLERIWMEKYLLDASSFARCDMLGFRVAVSPSEEV